MFRSEIYKLMTSICCTCIIQGPMTDGDEYEMKECIGTSPTQWLCKKCSASEDRQQHILQQSVESANRLSDLTNDCAIEAVKVQENDHQSSRLVFMPKCFVSNPPLQEDSTVVDPKKTTVVVPKHPDALDVFGEEATDAAFKAIHELKNCGEFISKRLIYTNLNAAMTILQTKKLAEIREGRVRMLHSMQTTSKGAVLSRDPNVGDIKQRKPHFAATKSFSLTDTCPWSEGHIQLKSEESTAIAWANGQVKTKVRVAVLNLDCPELMNVISIARDHYGDRLVGMLPLAPIVLQFARGKVKLMIKHLVSNLYDNWDLRVSFDKSNWGVELTGFLYSAQYDAINKKIARSGATLAEIVEAVTQHPEVQPTASLDPECIADFFGIREDAKVGATIFQKK